MNLVPIALLVLAVIIVALFIFVLIRTWTWKQKNGEPPLKGLALPEGSIRGLIGLIVIAGFVIFVFFGSDLFVTEAVTTDEQGKTVTTTTPNDDLYKTVLTAFGTLTGAVTGFYFGGRTATKAATAQPQIEAGESGQEEAPSSSEAVG